LAGTLTAAIAHSLIGMKPAATQVRAKQPGDYLGHGIPMG
jgi:hypothetical protein